MSLLKLGDTASTHLGWAVVFSHSRSALKFKTRFVKLSTLTRSKNVSRLRNTP